MNKSILTTKKNLKKNGFQVKIFDSSKEAKEALIGDISLDESVAFGGSMTLSQLGIYEDFKNKGYEIYWHWKGEDKKEELKKAHSSDIYVTSTNAITLDGKLVNMDGVGNRVSSMFYGHKRVYIIVGKNKICEDYDRARERILNTAAPKNAQRLNTNTPCRVTGECTDCSSVDRICNVEVTIHKNPTGSTIIIFLIDEDLGY